MGQRACGPWGMGGVMDADVSVMGKRIRLGEDPLPADISSICHVLWCSIIQKGLLTDIKYP